MNDRTRKGNRIWLIHRMSLQEKRHIVNNCSVLHNNVSYENCSENATLLDHGPVVTDDFAFAYTNGMRNCAFDSLRGSWSAHALMLYSLTRSFRDPLHGYERCKEELLSAFGAAKELIRRYLDKVRENTTSRTLWQSFRVKNSHKKI